MGGSLCEACVDSSGRCAVRFARRVNPLNHQIRQAVDRDGRGLGKGRQQRKLRDMQTARSKDRVDEERVPLLEKLLLWC